WVEFYSYAVEFFNKPSLTEAFVDILMCLVPFWVAVMIGLLVGWSWRPRWSGLIFLGLRSKFQIILTAPPGVGARRFWLALTAISAFSVCRRLWSRFWGRKKKFDSDGEIVGSKSFRLQRSEDAEDSSEDINSIVAASCGEVNKVTERDLEHLLRLLDGEITWQSMMERSTSNLANKAWSHEPKMGPVIYKSRTVFEDATPDLVRDFFWDDEFRPKWDPMLVYVKILEECYDTGMMISHWVKKFPFFCSDREYIIARRIWEEGNTYYCLTKGIEYPSVARCEKPHRVDHYFSSWVIKPVESLKGDGQVSACEVTLIHYEDMGIPKDIAKLGVRHGMWGTVKKLHAGLRAYQNAKKKQQQDCSLSRCSTMARITTKLPRYEEGGGGEEDNRDVVRQDGEDAGSGINWKLVAIAAGSIAAVVCGFQMRFSGKSVIIGSAAGQKIARRNK
ncbi:hypothetical protein M569_01819, partial [Genlisea aurea]